MRFSSKIDTLFLDPHSEYSAVDNKVNIILSPSLYWVKKQALPLKYVRDVKKLLPSIFEDTLPEGNYSYSAYKVEDEFYLFAYEDKLIIETLAQKGIPMSNVANVYFAQSELQNISGAVKINETQSIYVKDEMVVLVPCCWIEESGDLDLSAIKLSSHKISLAQFSHIVDNKSLYKIGAVLVALILLVATEFFITRQKVQYISELKDEVFVKNNLQSTMFQNKSMLKKYKNIHTKQTKLREYSSYILALRLKENEKMTQLSFKNKTLIAIFSGVKENNSSHIISSLKSKGVKFKTSFKDDILEVEMVL